MGISELHTQHRRITIKDIAAMANVSIGTVDRVLHNRGEVNQETQERVMSFVEKLGYTPNLLAKSLALKKSFTLVAMIPDAGDNNPYWKEPLEGFNKAAEELKDFNATIQVFNFDPGEVDSFLKVFQHIMETKPDGMIMAPNFHDAAKQVIPQCSAQNIPLMLIDNNIENGSGLAYFGQDAFRSGMVAAKLMHYGLRPNGSVLIINLARNKVITRHMQRREQGFKHFFDTEVPEHHILIRSIEIDLSQELEPLSTLQKVIGEQQAIDGIFVTNSRVHKVARFLAGKGAHRPTLIGYDLIDANLEFLEKGAIDYLICQKPQDQGYKSAMAMFNYLLTGKQAEKVNFSPIDIVMRENADYYRSINNIKSV